MSAHELYCCYKQKNAQEKRKQADKLRKGLEREQESEGHKSKHLKKNRERSTQTLSVESAECRYSFSIATYIAT